MNHSPNMPSSSVSTLSKWKSRLKGKISSLISTVMACMAASSLNQNEAEGEQVNDIVTVAGVNLPPDLIFNILCRLPVKTIGRLRCVCKDWQTLLSSGIFIKNQFLFNNHQTKFIFYQNNLGFISIEFRDCKIRGHPAAIYQALSFKTTNIMYALGSCNGLVLLEEDKTNRLSIVNPITHESRLLPPIPEDHVDFLTCGFGYCSYDDDHIVVIQVKMKGTDSGLVYILKSNLWKKVEIENPSFNLHGPGVFLNGSIHWFGSGDLCRINVIYAFDLASEKFREMELPELPKSWMYSHSGHLNVVGELLCFVCASWVHNDIWVLKEYGLRESWTKYDIFTRFDFGRECGHLQPMFFWNGDESIVAEYEGRLYLCFFNRRKAIKIPAIGQPSCYISARNWAFAESLLSPNSSYSLHT